MKSFIIILSFVMLFTASSIGQSTELVNQIQFDKKDLAAYAESNKKVYTYCMLFSKKTK